MPQEQNKYYQAPLEVNGYVNPNIAPIPKQPVDLYGLLGIHAGSIKKPEPAKKKTPYEIMMSGGDVFKGLIPDASPLDTNLATLKPLDDPAGLFHSQDGFGKYGYSSILAGGDNEARYADNFRKDNPHLFWREGFHPWEGIEKGAYWGGGFIEKTLESAVVKTGQGLSGLYGLTIGNGIDLARGKGFSDWVARSADNMFSNVFNSWDENLKERYHYFQEKSDRDKKGFTASLSDGDFWMNDVSDGLGFLVSAAFEVGLISKLGLGAKAASRIAPLAEGVSGASSVANGIDKAGMLVRGMNSVSSFLGGELTGNALVKTAVDVTAQTLATTVIESATEANEAKQKIYDSFEGRINPETGMYYTDDEKKRLSAAGAAQVFQQNMTILIGPQFLETLVFNRIGNAFKGMLNKGVNAAALEEGKASGRVRSRIGNFTSSAESLGKTSALRSILKYGSAAGIGFVSEGLFEENIQLAISRDAEEKFGAADEFYRPGTKKSDIDKMESSDDIFGDVGRRYWRQTKQFAKGVTDSRYIDDELSKSVGIGGAFGVGGGAIHVTLGLRQQAKVDRYWNDQINKATKSMFESQNFMLTKTIEVPDPNNPGKTKPEEVVVTDPKTGRPVLDENKLKGFLNKMGNIQGLMEIINNTEDPNDETNKTHQNKELNKLARTVLFTKLAMEYIRAGKKDALLANLQSIMNFSDKDIQALGYEPGMKTDQEKKEIISKMTRIVDRLSKMDEWIDNNVIDNVSEPRQGFGGIKYSRTQKEKRREEFEAKKAYLRGLAMQNVLLDSHLDDITDLESKLDQVTPEILSSVYDSDGNMLAEDEMVNLRSLTRNFNSRIPALRNHIAVLQKEFAYHWDNVESYRRNSPKGQDFNKSSKTINGANLAFSQMKADEALEKINELQAELDRLTGERNAFLANDKAFELREEDGEFYVLPKRQEKSAAQLKLDQLQADKVRRINDVKRREIEIQKEWLDREWQLTAALKEKKTESQKYTRDQNGKPVFGENREETYFSRRMTLTKNAYNTYFQREVMDRDNSLGQRKIKLYHKDEAKRINAKKYKSNEEKLIRAERIKGKVRDILATVNGQKLLAEIETLIQRDLTPEEFAAELKAITDSYKGKPLVVKDEDKNLVDEHIEALEDEYNFVGAFNDEMAESLPEDDRFNDKYYDVSPKGFFVLKPQYDDLAAVAQVREDLKQRIEDLEKIKAFLNGIDNQEKGGWDNVNNVKRQIAEVYFETADDYINAYNLGSNNGQSDYSGDGLSTRQDLDKIDEEIDELGQLKKIFEERNKTDMILATPEFKDFIKDIDDRIEQLKKIREIVKERLASRLRENQDFLVDAVNNFTEQLGLNFDGTIMTLPIHDKVESLVGKDILDKLKKSLTDLKELSEKADKTKEDEKKIVDSYWNINGQVSAIQELLKSKDRDAITSELSQQKAEAIKRLENTALMQKLKSEGFYSDIMDNIGTSLLGALQTIFYNTGAKAPFSQVGLGGTDGNFIDDQPSSPIYKFREDYNLRKLIRNVEKDESRTPDKTDISKDELLEFLKVAKEIQNLEDLEKSLSSTVNLLDLVEKEKQVISEKKAKQDNKYENLIVSSIQQIFFIRSIASFLRRETGVDGFKNWTYIQAPGGSGKTQTLGTWFNLVSGIPRDKVLATAFTEEAARGIKKALIVGETGPKDAAETVDFISNLTKNKKFDHEVLIIDEFPAIDITTQQALFNAIKEYSKAKKEAGKGEFKVIAMGDTNQLTFSDNGSVASRPGIITNHGLFNDKKNPQEKNHPSQMSIIPSLTVNFRSNLFPVTSFIDVFKGSSKDNVNEPIKVTSSDSSLEGKDVKGVVAVTKSDFKSKLVSYIKKNLDSTRTRTLIVNEDKIPEYIKLLQDAGIKIITDPNDELTKGGVYLTTVKNVQGFSFDEVFIDLENNDKTLFSGSSNPNYVYNKAMYVAASRARNLIVVTNFSNVQNLEDSSIESLESKALAELQTKDDDFLANRESEINGAKDILGSEYKTRVKTKPPTQPKAEKAVQTPLDQKTKEEEKAEKEAETVTEEDKVAAEKEAAREEEEKKREKEEPEVKEESPEESDEFEEEMEAYGEVVEGTTGEEAPEQEEELVETEETPEEAEETIIGKIRDIGTTVYHKIRDGIMELLFPTGQTLKFKIANGEFSVRAARIAEGYEQKALQDGDEVMIIPFIRSKVGPANRRFGYAVVTKAIDDQGNVIENHYRTVAVLSDKEIDGLRSDVKTNAVYQAILENEQRDEAFVGIRYNDVWSENGFVTEGNTYISERDIIATAKVAHANPIKYFYGKNYRPLHGGELESVIENFIQSYYKNHLDNFGPVGSAERNGELERIRQHYRDKNNAQVVIPINRDVIETRTNKPRFDVPPELKPYVRPGRPYIIFKPIASHARSDWQFIPLSRRFLNKKLHNEVFSPIEEFIRLGKEVRDMLYDKGIDERFKFGYSRSMSAFLSKAAVMYQADTNQDSYDVEFTYTDRNTRNRITNHIILNNSEMRRLSNFYSLYSQPSAQWLTATTRQELENMTRIKRARNLVFDDSSVIYGVVVSVNPDNSFVVRDYRNKDEQGNYVEVTKTGTIQHSARTTIGEAQQTLDNIMLSNSHIAKNFASEGKKVGFASGKGGIIQGNLAETRGYKFMALLGSKVMPVAKSYNNDGTVAEFYEDVFDILEDLFTFEGEEMPAKSRQYVNADNEIQSMDIQFRVPVPITHEDTNPDNSHDYSYGSSNTSRETTNAVINEKYFETNFESLMPSRVILDFSKEAAKPAEEVTPTEEVTEVTPAEEVVEEVPPTPISELTKEEIQRLPLSEIRRRLTPEQEQRLANFLRDEIGYPTIEEFYEEFESYSAYPEQQAQLRDYIIECLL